MNAVLEEIFATRTVTNGATTLPLSHPDFPNLPVHMDEQEGRLLQRVIADVRPAVSLEIGFAYGVSTLFICDALAAAGGRATHIVMDPYQSTQWRGIGLRNVREAGYDDIVRFYEEKSEFVLPKLAAEGVKVDFALVDGWHTFDQVMLEFYYLNRMLNVGGAIVFDDADRKSVNRVIRYALRYPAYNVFGTSAADGRPTLAGRARRWVANRPAASRVLRRDLLWRDWDLGVMGSCVALRKVAEDRRTSGWYEDF